jgi:hypothetical protein
MLCAMDLPKSLLVAWGGSVCGWDVDYRQRCDFCGLPQSTIPESQQWDAISIGAISRCPLPPVKQFYNFCENKDGNFFFNSDYERVY